MLKLWVVPLVQGMYINVQSRVHDGEGYSQKFEVMVRVYQGSVPNAMLFIIVLEVPPWRSLGGPICR